MISIETTPYDVEFGGFQGGTINIVTKSGTNEFHGSIFGHYTDQSMIGDMSEGREINIGEFEEKFYGATLGGPIIKYRLWFFISYEKFEGSDPDATLFCVEEGNCANPIPGVTQADVDQISAISQSVYGYDPLPLFQSATAIQDEKWLAKLDWQINDNHNMSLTYQYVDGTDLIDQGNSTFSRRLGLPSNFYNRGETMTAVSAQLFSRWTDAFSTEFKVAYKDVDNLQAPLGATEFGQMEVDLASGGAIRFGPDQFRHANFLLNENWQLKAKADYAWGVHVSTFGYEYDFVDIFNIFAPTSLGNYAFTSVEDFANQRADSVVLANISTTGNVDDLAGVFTNTIHSFYLQDRWDIKDNLTIQAGLRLDAHKSSDEPIENANFLARNGFSNTETMDGRSVLMPRFGFNWQPYDRTTIRGGAGLFSGGLPSGFLSNSFSNVGILNQNGFFGRDAMENITVDGFNIDPSLIAQLQPGDGNVAAIHPDFDLPSSWKINLAWDQLFDLGGQEDFLFSVDLLFSWVKNAPVWVDGRREVIGTAADGRPIYGAPGCMTAETDPYTTDCRQIPNYDVIMTDTGKGKNHSLSASLSKNWEMGVYGDLSARVSYTWQDSQGVSDALSSTPTSLIGREQTFDRNNSLVSRSSFETTHRIISNLTWRKTFAENLVSTLSFFFQSQSGKPYGYTYDAPRIAFGDTFGGNEPIDDDDTQLLYVPTGLDDPLVIFAPGFDFEGWEELLDGEQCLSKFRGSIAKKNSCTSPWHTRVDMRFIQEFRLPGIGFLNDHALEFILDIENLGNLINSDWGRYEQISFPFTANVITLNPDLGPNGELIYDRFRAENFSVSNNRSLYKIQVGLRYRF